MSIEDIYNHRNRRKGRGHGKGGVACFPLGLGLTQGRPTTDNNKEYRVSLDKHMHNTKREAIRGGGAGARWAGGLELTRYIYIYIYIHV